MSYELTPIAGTSLHTMGFSWWRGWPDPSMKHRHPEVELLVISRARVRWSYAAKVHHIVPGRLAVLWGIRLHGALAAPATAIADIVRMPLARVLRWRLPDWFVQRLLSHGVVFDEAPPVSGAEMRRLRRWHDLMQREIMEADRIVELEVEARMRELALTLEHRGFDSARPLAPGSLTHFEAIATIVAQRYRHPLRVSEIAKMIGIHRVSANRIFRSVTGTSLNQYITQHRLAHAQQMLASTDAKVDQIARDSGFRSVSRFYEAFEANIGFTPSQYRVRWRHR